MRIKDIKYWFLYRFHPKYRYHVIKFAEPGWCDRDHAILLCCFKLLVEFIDKEVDSPTNVKIDWEADPSHSHAIREMRSLYFWWKFQRDRDEQERSDLFEKIYNDCKKNKPDPWANPNDPEVGINPLYDSMHQHPDYTEYENLDAYVETIDDKQLDRLMKIRGFMWT